MKITVTAEHIAKGKIKACRECPVALAIRECFPDTEDFYIVVGNTFVNIHRKEYILPEEVSMYIRAFDAGKSILPFEFELDYNAN